MIILTNIYNNITEKFVDKLFNKNNNLKKRNICVTSVKPVLSALKNLLFSIKIKILIKIEQLTNEIIIITVNLLKI